MLKRGSLKIAHRIDLKQCPPKKRPGSAASIRWRRLLEVYRAQLAGAKIRAQHARERAKEVIREADRAEAEASLIRKEGYGGPAQPLPTIWQETSKRDAYGWSAVVFDFSRNSCLWRLDHSVHHSIGIALSLDALGNSAGSSRLDQPLSGNPWKLVLR